MDSDSPLVTEHTEQHAAVSTATSDALEALKLQIDALRNELIEKDNQHRTETRILNRDIYALNRANEDLQSKIQQVTIEFNGWRHEFTSQRLDLQEREIDQHLELVGLSTSLKAIADETDNALIASKITEQVLLVNTMAARRIAISDTPSKKRKRASDCTSSGSDPANENGQGANSSSADSLGREWSAILQPVASSSLITPSSVNTSRGPISTPSSPIRPGKRRDRLSKTSLCQNKPLDRRLGDYPDNHVMESRTLVWGKVPSNPWYPGIVLLDEDIRRDNLKVPIPVSAKFEQKNSKTPHVPHFIIRFFDNNWACVPLSNLKMLGEISELDRDMIALHSQFQGKWTGKRHAEINDAYQYARNAIASDSE